MKGVFLDADSIAPGDLNIAHLNSEFSQLELYPSTLKEQRFERTRYAEVVITNKIQIDKGLLEKADKLQLILVAATGANNIDLEAARQSGVAVANVTGYSAPSVAQHSFALILALTTQLMRYCKDVQSGIWSKNHFFCLLHHPITELSGKKLAIIGYGEIGKAVARAAQGFGMEVLVAESLASNHTHTRKEIVRHPLEKLLRVADVVTLHCPLTANTENLIDKPQLDAMKPSALLINTARGGLVNETALLDALKNASIAGAGVDVLTTEPPSTGNILLDNPLPNLIVTPHCAWGSREARQRLVDEMVLNLHAFKSGLARNRLV